MRKRKRSYKNIIKFVNEVTLSQDLNYRIEHAYKNSNKYRVMQSCLFSGNVSEYLWELLDAFEIYITGIYFKKSISEDLEESAYERILNLIDSKDFDM